MRVGTLGDSSASCVEPMDEAQERRHRALFERTRLARRDRAHDPARHHHHHRTLEALSAACTYRQGAWQTSYGHTEGGAGDAAVPKEELMTYKTAMMAPAAGAAWNRSTSWVLVRRGAATSPRGRRTLAVPSPRPRRALAATPT